MKPNIEEYAILLAKTVARRSEDPHHQVGAVVLDKDARIVSTGYNGLSPGLTVAPGFWNSREHKSRYMLHAEMNACAGITRGEGHLLAVTLSPCVACAKVIVSLGIKRVIFAVPYDRDPEAIEILYFHKVSVDHVDAN